MSADPPPRTTQRGSWAGFAPIVRDERAIVPVETLFFSDGGPHVLAESPSPTARGAQLHALLESGIAGLTQLDTQPFSEPADLGEDAPPIEEYLYQGRAALDRAIELRNEIRAAGRSVTTEDIEELFALLDLATAG